MMNAHPSAGDRIKAGAAVLLIHAIMGYALLTGLGVAPVPLTRDAALTLFTVLPEPPRPEPKPVAPAPRQQSPRKEGAAAPPNIRSKPKDIAAPPPIVRTPVPPPLILPPRAANGPDLTQGAAQRPGPGTGAGGSGDGTGSGDAGDGDGGGGGTPPRLISGRIRDSDFPRSLAEAGVGGTVGVRYVVEVNGRVTRCAVTRSSGNMELDAITCRLIEQRFRYRPSRDDYGDPVPSVIVENHSWIVEDMPTPHPGDDR